MAASMPLPPSKPGQIPRTWPVQPGEPLSYQHLNALGAVLGHMLSCLPTKHLEKAQGTGLQLLRMKAIPDLDTKRACLEELDAQHDQDVLGLLRNPKLVAALWALPAHHLYGPVRLAMAPGAQSWVQQRPSPLSIAQKSLVEWSGESPLHVHIEQMFGCFQCPKSGWTYLQASGMPLILRVVYDQTLHPITSYASYANLRKITMSVPELVLDGDVTSKMNLTERRVHYRLIASIGIGKDVGNKVITRFYSTTGFNMMTPCPANTNDANTRIGSPGFSWILIFALCIQDVPDAEESEVKIFTNDSLRTQLDMLDTSSFDPTGLNI